MEAIFLDLNVLNAYQVDHANVWYTIDLMGFYFHDLLFETNKSKQ